MRLDNAFLAFVLLLAGAMTVTSCHKEPTIEFGEACESDGACITGVCVGDGTHSDRGLCTKTCGPDTPCPDGWSCSALTAGGLVVCARGSGIPDLHLDPGSR